MQSFVQNFVSGVQSVASGANTALRFKECIAYIVRNKDEIFSCLSFLVSAVSRLYDEPQYKEELDYWKSILDEIHRLEPRALLMRLGDKSLFTKRLDYVLMTHLIPGLIKSLARDIADWGSRSSINLWAAQTSVSMLTKNLDNLSMHAGAIAKKLPRDSPLLTDEGEPVTDLIKKLLSTIKKETMRLELEMMAVEKNTIGYSHPSAELLPYEEDLLAASQTQDTTEATPMKEASTPPLSSDEEVKPPPKKRRKTKKQ